MQLAVWTYEAPPHVGAMRVATAMEGLHYVLHAPQGDTYADLLFTMIERLPKRPPVTYTTFQARDLGSDTAQLFKDAAADAYERFRPEAMIVGASCTAELIQDDPGGLARALALPIPVIPLELPAYQKKENWGAAETFYQLVRTLAAPRLSPSAGEVESAAAAGDRVRGATASGEVAPLSRSAGADSTSPAEEERSGRPRCNILGPTALGFRHRDDVAEITRLLGILGIDVNVTAPLGARPADLARLGDADFNVVLYPEVAATAARWLEKTYGQPSTKTVPIGVMATRDFVAEVAKLADVDPAPALAGSPSRLPWYSRSVDSTYLTGKRVFIFGDATHAIAAARIAAAELGFAVVGLGTYSREMAREVREAAKVHGLDALITDDYLEVEARIVELQPELVLGTQMERHVAKRLGIACAVISAPVHVQDFPARYSPQMGFEGANVIFDTWVHPLMMGLEEHLIGMFREDSEFRDDASSHLGHGVSTAPDPSPAGGGLARQREPGGDARLGSPHPGSASPTRPSPAGEGSGARPSPIVIPATLGWAPEAERELGKIPFFVRGKARRNTESFAKTHGLALITLETLYDAKAHFGR